MDKAIGALLLIGGVILTLGLEYLPDRQAQQENTPELVCSAPESPEPVFATNSTTHGHGFSPLENKPESAFAAPPVQAELVNDTETEAPKQKTEAVPRRRLLRR